MSNNIKKNVKNRLTSSNVVSVFVVSVIMFFLIVLILFRQVSVIFTSNKYIQGYIHKDFNNHIYSSVDNQEIDKKLNDTLNIFFNINELNIGNNGLGLGIWTVVSSLGATIRVKNDLTSDIVSNLPIGSLVIGEIVDYKNNDINKKRLYITFPIYGYMSIVSNNNITIVSPLQIKKNGIENEIDNKNPLLHLECKVMSTIISDIDLNGGDLPSFSPIQTSNYIDCCQFCLTNPDCLAWTFTKESSFCWLKGTKSYQLKKVSNEVIYSGILNDNAHKIKNNYKTMNKKNPNYCCNNEINYSQLDNSNNHHSLTIKRNSVAWSEQWPIGNGNFGALVGGTIDSEVIPISIAGFYVIPTKISKAQSKDHFKDFQESRQHLLHGRIHEAEKKINDIQESGLGMFQYLSDISIIFSNSLLHESPTHIIPPINLKQKAKNIGGRKEVLDRLKNKFNPKNIIDDNDQILLSQGILDMKHGVAHSYYLVEEDNAVNNNSHDSVFKIHQREWFASSIDNVIVGKMNCRRFSIGSRKFDLSSCLNVALQLSRDNGAENNFIKPFLSIKKISLPSYIDNDLLLKQSHNDIGGEIFSLDFSIKSNKDLSLPDTYMCGLVICNASSSNNHVYEKDNSNYLLCNNASNINIIISSYLNQSLDIDNQNYRNCWRSISKALSIGTDNLRSRHMIDFAQRMARTEISLGDVNKLKICNNDELEDRIRRISSDCIDKDSKENINVIDTSLIGQNFAYGRYLFFSSALKSPSGLQGLWADGPTSPWNGDFHMNINMQQSYWLADIAGASETMIPLVDFIQKLSINGRYTSKNLYGCKSPDAWVAHGFTDNRMKTGMIGEPQWSLCVTCGAWLALHIFDHLTFKFSKELLIEKNIPILRGPTTSPENSYEVTSEVKDNIVFKKIHEESVNLEKKNLRKSTPSNQKFLTPKKVSFLAMSPAIDISILRQVSNAFSLSIEWAKIVKDMKDIIPYEDYDQDVILSQKFSKAISNMPGNGIPVIGKVSNKILEYPNPLPDYASNNMNEKNDDKNIFLFDIFDMNSKTNKNNSNNDKDSIIEDVDAGHRHFSAMHWLYPGIFPPTDMENVNAYSKDVVDETIEAGKKFMMVKALNNGGHTSWSAAWESCIWARLHESENSLKSLIKLLKKYSSPNLLSLHPPLAKRDTPGCSTCFEEHPLAKRRVSGVDATPITGRGLSTVDDYKFQLDGNLGFVAAICEMLLQSHLPKYYLLLPSLPKNISYGYIKGIRGRGDVEVDIKWKKGNVIITKLHFKSYHPWLLGQIRTNSNIDGFFSVPDNSNFLVDTEIFISSPNIIKFISISDFNSSNIDNNCASIEKYFLSSNNNNNYHISNHWIKNSHLLKIKIKFFPCAIYLCDSNINDENCILEAQHIVNPVKYNE